MSNLKIPRQGVEQQDMRLPYREYTAAGAIDPIGGCVVINNAANIALTLTPKSGQLYIFFCQNTDTGSTVTLGGSFTWDGTNDVATFDADGEQLIVFFIGTRAVVVSNPPSVAFS